MASCGTVNQLSLGGKSPRKLLSEAEGLRQQFTHRASPHTSGRQVDCSLQSYGISVYCDTGHLF